MDVQVRATDGLEVDAVFKAYGQTQALRGVSFTAARGEITAVVGANGAGKSTLMKILAGEERPDSGLFRLDGEQFDGGSGRGLVAIVHQEPVVFPNLTIKENLYAGREEFLFGRPVLRDRDAELLAQFEIISGLNRELGTLPLSYRQRVEIVRALMMDADVVLFDEPNSALGKVESEALFAYMRTIAESGKVVILISHRLTEVETLASSAIVLKDGVVHKILRHAEVSSTRMAQEMLSRPTLASAGEVADLTNRQVSPVGQVVMDMSQIAEWATSLDPQVLLLREGEVVALAGLEGSGARELVEQLPQILAGKTSGEWAFNTGDKKLSLIQEMTIADNIVLRTGGRFKTRWGLRNHRAAASFSREVVDQYRIKCAGVGAPVSSLSGGNQQKVSIASSLVINPRVLVVEEPTRGIDLESRAEIHALLREHAIVNRAGVVFFSSEEIEIPVLADRVLVFRDGIIAEHHYVGNFLDPHELAEWLAGSSDTIVTPKASPI